MIVALWHAVLRRRTISVFVILLVPLLGLLVWAFALDRHGGQEAGLPLPTTSTTSSPSPPTLTPEQEVEAAYREADALRTRAFRERRAELFDLVYSPAFRFLASEKEKIAIHIRDDWGITSAPEILSLQVQRVSADVAVLEVVERVPPYQRIRWSTGQVLAELPGEDPYRMSVTMEKRGGRWRVLLFVGLGKATLAP
ncbi:MAG: hypothetical protein WDA71_06560 [Actinomycetota bacterium]